MFQLEGTSQVKNIAVGPRVTVSADAHGVVSHAGMGVPRELADRTGLSGRSPPRWRTPTGAPVGVCALGRCSRAWRPRWRTGRTESTGSDNCAANVSTCSVRRRRRPRCGGWSLRGSTPHTFLGGADRACCCAGSGLAVRSHPRCRAMAAHRHRCHAGDRSLRQQGRCCTDLEEIVRSSSAAGVFGSPGDRPGGEALAGMLRCGNASTPPVTTSSSWSRHWPPCPPRGDRTCWFRTGRRWWCVETPPEPPTDSPTRVAPPGRGSPSATPH